MAPKQLTLIRLVVEFASLDFAEGLPELRAAPEFRHYHEDTGQVGDVVAHLDSSFELPARRFLQGAPLHATLSLEMKDWQSQPATSNLAEAGVRDSDPAQVLPPEVAAGYHHLAVGPAREKKHYLVGAARAEYSVAVAV